MFLNQASYQLGYTGMNGLNVFLKWPPRLHAPNEGYEPNGSPLDNTYLETSVVNIKSKTRMYISDII